MPEIDNMRHKYEQIAAHIRDRILSGDLRPGDGVPSERELATTWTVARPTAAKALNILRQQGYVESWQGSGTYVRDRSPVPRMRERYEPASRCAIVGEEDESVEYPHAAIVLAPAHVAAALGIAQGSRVIERTRLVNRELVGPVEVSTFWFPETMAQVAPRLLECERIRGGAIPYLESVTGRHASVARDTVCARLANADERRYLGLPRAAAVLVYRLSIHDADDRVMQYGEASYPQGQWAFHQEYPFAL